MNIFLFDAILKVLGESSHQWDIRKNIQYFNVFKISKSNNIPGVSKMTIFPYCNRKDRSKVTDCTLVQATFLLYLINLV